MSDIINVETVNNIVNILYKEWKEQKKIIKSPKHTNC